MTWQAGPALREKAIQRTRSHLEDIKRGRYKSYRVCGGKPLVSKQDALDEVQLLVRMIQKHEACK